MDRDADAVERRRAEHIESQRMARRAAREKQVTADFLSRPSVMAAKFVDAEEQVASERRSKEAARAEVSELRAQLEGMAPSKLSTLSDLCVSAFTPFRSKVTLVAFLLKMVLPNLQHAWGFAGFKDQYDQLRREADAAAEDDRFDTTTGRVTSNELERERYRIHRVLVRQIRRRSKRSQEAICSYQDCRHPNDPLCPCEQMGLCPHLAHARCSKGGDRLLCRTFAFPNCALQPSVEFLCGLNCEVYRVATNC